MRARFLSSSLLLAGVMLAAGCARAEPAPQLAQVIVKFRPATFACDARGIADLSRKTGLDLQWLRPMSGDACVLIVRSATPAKALATLQARPELEWAEADAIMRPNSP